MSIVLLCMTARIMELISVPKTIPSPCSSVYAIASSASIPVLNSGQENERRAVEDSRSLCSQSVYNVREFEFSHNIYNFSTITVVLVKKLVISSILDYRLNTCCKCG
jgi:hypothetical protein